MARQSAAPLFRSFMGNVSPCPPRWAGAPVMVLIIACMIVLTCASLSRAMEKNLLVLHSYHGELAWDRSIDEGIRSVFAAEQDRVGVRIEYMDTKRMDSAGYIQGLRDLYSIKFRDIRFDAIISVDHAALEFLTRYRQELFPSTPVIFSGINHLQDAVLRKRDLYAGIVEAENIRETLSLAMELHPGLGHVYIYGTNPPDFFTNILLAENGSPDFRDLLKFHFVEGLSMEEVKTHARNLPANSIILQVSFMRDETSALIPLEAFIRMTAEQARVPVYGCWDYLLGHGIIGGKLISGTALGETAARLALKIMNGEDTGESRVIARAPGAHMFDHKQLTRFGISLSDLPSGSRIVNRPVSFYARHKPLILPGTATIIFLLLTIGVLVMNIAKRRQSENALKSSHERFLTVLESIDAHIYVCDLAKYEILYMNKTMKESFGRDLTGEICWRSFRGEKRPCPLCTNPVLLDDQGAPMGVQAWEDVNPITGRWYINYDRAIKWVDGRMVKLQIATDITRLKEMDTALRKSEERLRLIAESSVDAIWKIDLEGRLVYVSPAAYKLFGFTPEEVKGKHFQTFFARKHRARTEQVFDRAVSFRQKQIVEFDIIRRDRKIVPVEVSVSPIVKLGRVIGVQGVARDVTERKKALREIRESELVSTTIFDSVQTGILIIDPEHHLILDANPAATRLIGAAKEEIVGRTCHRFTCSAQEGACPITDLAQKIDNSERLLYTTAGEAVPIIKTVTPFTYRGKPALLESFIDIRALKESERQKGILESQLRQTQKMEAMGALAGGIAHDFNNILFPIIGYSELIMDDLPQQSPEGQMLEEIIRAGQRGKELVRQILSFSRQAELARTPMRVQTVLKEVLKLLKSTIPANIKIRQKIDNSCGLVLADPTQVHQIAMNLITNAYHAMEENGGELTVALTEASPEAHGARGDHRDTESHVCITVSDTGPGIDPLVKERIFEPYFTTKRKGKGTGLGLSVVHGIVKNFGGEIRVGEPEQGAAFHVYLPLIPMGEDEKEGGEPSQVIRGTGHILLVDDEEPIVNMEKKMLERLGYKVTERTGSIDALEAFRSNPEGFDLVITDMMMPNMTGTQLSEKLLEIKEDIPIIICTGFSDRIDRHKAGALGIREFVMKPVLRNKISAVIQKVLAEDTSSES